MAAEKEEFQSWAVLELMGHRKLAGFVREETVFGQAMCRIDVPEIDGKAAFTQWYGGQSIYGMTPVSEQVARGIAAQLRSAPISVYDLPAVMRDDQARLSFRRDDPEEDDDRPF